MTVFTFKMKLFINVIISYSQTQKETIFYARQTFYYNSRYGFSTIGMYKLTVQG